MAKKDNELIYFAPYRGRYEAIRLPRSKYGENEARADALRNGDSPGTLAELYPQQNAQLGESWIPFCGSITARAQAGKPSNPGFTVLPGGDEIIIDKIEVSTDSAGRYSLWRLDDVAPAAAEAAAAPHGIIIQDQYGTGIANAEDVVFRPRNLLSALEMALHATFWRFNPGAADGFALGAETGVRLWRGSLAASAPVVIYDNKRRRDDFRLQQNRCLYISQDHAGANCNLSVFFRAPLNSRLLAA